MFIINSCPANEIQSTIKEKVASECSAMISQLVDLTKNKFEIPSIDFRRIDKNDSYAIQLSTNSTRFKDQLNWVQENIPTEWNEVAIRELNKFKYFDWSKENNHTSFRQGWGLFTVDSGKLAIQKLDEPENTTLDVLNEEFEGTTFESDDEAIKFVENNKSCQTCKLAVRLVQGQK